MYGILHGVFSTLPHTAHPTSKLSFATRTPQTTFGRHLCLHRFKLWWLKPSHGHSGLNIPPETALLLAERRPPLPSPGNTCPSAEGVPPLQPQQQEYVALLPVSDTRARASLHRAGDSAASAPVDAEVSGASSSSCTVLDHDPSALAVSADTGDAATPLPGKLGVLLVATGPDPFRLVRRLVREATERLRAQLRSLSLEEGRGSAAARAGAVAVAGDAGAVVAGGGGVVVAAEGGDSVGDGRGDGPKEALAASFVDTFGWCTWDSFYTMVTPEGAPDAHAGDERSWSRSKMGGKDWHHRIESNRAIRFVILL